MINKSIMKEEDDVLGMLTRKILGRTSGSLETAQRDLYYWKCFIAEIKKELREE